MPSVAGTRRYGHAQLRVGKHDGAGGPWATRPRISIDQMKAGSVVAPTENWRFSSLKKVRLKRIM